MKRLKYLLLLLPLSLLSQNVLFKTFAKQDGLPEPFVKLDSIFKDLYDQSSEDLKVEMLINHAEDEELLEYAKILTLVNVYPNVLVHNYFGKANAPYDDQFKRKMLANKEGKTFNEVRQIKPGALNAYIEKQIFERLPWQWEFHLRNKYILYVKVLQAETKKIGTDGHINAPYYHVEVLDDLKGNLGDEKNIEIAGIHIIGRMVEGKRYIVFLKYKHPTEPHYSTRGLATKDYGFLPVVNNNIIDEINVLHMNAMEIEFKEFKNRINSFYNNLKKNKV